MSIHDHQPKSKTSEKDLSADDLQFLHAAPSHERTATSGGRRRNWLLGSGAVAGVAGIVSAGIFTLGGGDKAPAGKNDRQEAGSSHSAEPTVSPEGTPTPEVEPVELGYVTKAEHPKPADALIALEERRLALISDTLAPSFEEWDAANPGKTTGDYMNDQLSTIFGEGFDPKDPMVKNVKYLQELFEMNNENLQFGYDNGDIDTFVQYRISLGKDTEILGVDGTRITYLPDFDVYAVDANSADGKIVEVPAGYESELLESLPENGNYESTSVLAEEDGHWIIVD